MPLASGKVSDLSYYKKPQSAEASPPPPPPEYKHKIGEATFPLEELKGMSCTCSCCTAVTILGLANSRCGIIPCTRNAVDGRPSPTGMNSDHGIDPANKEMYLTDEEFQSSFEMDKSTFQVSVQ